MKLARSVAYQAKVYPYTVNPAVINDVVESDLLHKLGLQFQHDHITGPLLCPFCGTVFEPENSVVVLDDGEVPLGYICERCFMMGPHVAAHVVHERTARLRAFAERARRNVPQASWLTMVHALQERIDQWDDLASRVDQLGWWTLKESPADSEIPTSAKS